MTSRTLVLPMAVLTGLAILVAACGGPAASQGPAATPVPATQAPATQAPVATAGVSSFDIPSFHADQDLEELFPDSIGGAQVSVQSISGTDFMAFGAATELTAALTALGKTPDDLSVAIGGAGGVLISALKIDGASGSRIMDALFAAYQAETATVTDLTIGGKAVKKVVQADSPDDVSYVYTARDVVFAVGSGGSEGLTDAQLNEVFSKLP